VAIKPYNVVVLSSDGINAEEMSVYGYGRQTTPFLDSVNSEFRVYQNAFSNNGNTTGSITSLLTGRSPLTTDVVYPPDALDATDAQLSLPYLLGNEGWYRSNWAVPHYADATDQNLVGSFDVDNGDDISGSLLEALPWSTGPQRWFMVSTLQAVQGLALDVLGIEELDNPFGQIEVVIGNTITDADRVAAIRSEIRESDRFFINAHFMVTHGPVFDIDEPEFSRGSKQKELWEGDFYDDAIRAFDSNVRAVYEALESNQNLDDTILIVTSDHGQRYDATRRVPLLIRFPGGENAGRSDINVQRMDVAPTILDVLGYQTPRWMSGHSLLDESDVPDDRQFLAATTAKRNFSHRMGFRTGRNDIVITAIRCDGWLQKHPDGTVDRGTIKGSTSTCHVSPSIPDGALTAH
jgi:arylsulfatase A-like enzyme